jgi:LacI family transcriptional regulator
MSKKASTIARLKDVAAEAKVSLTSASRILGGDGQRYAVATQKRVHDAAQKLGWRRNALVNSMQTGHTKSIGVMMPPYDSFWVEVLVGIHEALSEVGYLPITIWPRGFEKSGEFERQKAEGFELISNLLDRRVDGLLLWPAYAVAYCDHFSELVGRAVPMGAVEHRFPKGKWGESVESDEKQIATIVANHLFGLGHRRIACLSTREIAAQTWAVRRRQNFEAAMKKRRGVTCESWRLNEAGDNGIQVARDLLTSSLKPTAVFGVSDHEARLIYTAADELAIRIPEDISVIGCGDLDFASALSPGLTTLDRRPRVMGRLLAELVISRLSHPEDDTSSVSVSVGLIERGSTCKVS